MNTRTAPAIKIGKSFITVNGKRVGVRYSAGPWVAGVDPATIKIRPKQYAFPAEVRAVFAVENNSDSQTDYFEKDTIRIVPGHPLYDAVKAAAAA